jgi:hypothetical protein
VNNCGEIGSEARNAHTSARLAAAGSSRLKRSNARQVVREIYQRAFVAAGRRRRREAGAVEEDEQGPGSQRTPPA